MDIVKILKNVIITTIKGECFNYKPYRLFGITIALYINKL